jgi:hypothetical protein
MSDDTEDSEASEFDYESIQSCGVHYAANAITSSSFAGWKPR